MAFGIGNVVDAIKEATLELRAIRTELQGLRTDVDRLRPSPLPTRPAEARYDDHLRGEIVSLREVITGWIEKATATREAEVPRQQPRAQEPPAQPPRSDISTGYDFDDLLSLASGVAYAKLSCHRDAWDWLVKRSAGGKHFRLPGVVQEEDGCLVDTDLSGPTLLDVIEAMWRIRHDAAEDATTRSMAARVYRAVGDALKKVQPQEYEAGQVLPRVTRIVINDRPSPASG